MVAPPSLPRSVDSLLDVGCGIRPQNFVTADRCVGIDAHRPYLQQIQPVYTNWTLICGRANEVLARFTDASFDLVLAMDFIEHLTRRSGWRFLREAQRVGRQVAVFTPLGYMEQSYGPDELDAWGMDGTHWQTHRSGWTPQDFPGWDIDVLTDFHRNASAFWAITKEE